MASKFSISLAGGWLRLVKVAVACHLLWSFIAQDFEWYSLSDDGVIWRFIFVALVLTVWKYQNDKANGKPWNFDGGDAGGEF